MVGRHIESWRRSRANVVDQYFGGDWPACERPLRAHKRSFDNNFAKVSHGPLYQRAHGDVFPVPLSRLDRPLAEGTGG